MTRTFKGTVKNANLFSEHELAFFGPGVRLTNIISVYVIRGSCFVTALRPTWASVRFDLVFQKPSGSVSAGLPNYSHLPLDSQNYNKLSKNT